MPTQSERLQEVSDMLKDARSVIDGECNCATAEYRALDLLEAAMDRLVYILRNP